MSKYSMLQQKVLTSKKYRSYRHMTPPKTRTLEEVEVTLKVNMCILQNDIKTLWHRLRIKANQWTGPNIIRSEVYNLDNFIAMRWE